MKNEMIVDDLKIVNKYLSFLSTQRPTLNETEINVKQCLSMLEHYTYSSITTCYYIHLSNIISIYLYISNN